MDKEKLLKIRKAIGEYFKKEGIPFDQIVSLTEELDDAKKSKERKLLAIEIAKHLKPVVSKEEIIEAIKNIKISAPIVNVEPQKPIIKNIPPPKVEVKTQKVVMQEKKIVFPKETKVTGFTGLTKTITDFLKSEIKVSLGGISVKKPLPVELVFESEIYKALGGGGGGPSRVWIKNKNNQTINPVEVAKTPTIYNVAMTAANTEYSQALPTGTKKVDIKLRGTTALLKIAFAVGKSGTTYITIPFGSSLHLEGMDLTGVTVYAQSPTASQTLEILCWI